MTDEVKPKSPRARRRRARRLEAANRAAEIKLGEPALRKIIQFQLRFDALLSPTDAEQVARMHLESIGLHVHTCLATGVQKIENAVLRPDGRDALELYEFHAEVSIPESMIDAVAGMAEAESERAGGSSDGTETAAPVRDTQPQLAPRDLSAESPVRDTQPQLALRDTSTGDNSVEAGS